MPTPCPAPMPGCQRDIRRTRCQRGRQPSRTLSLSRLTARPPFASSRTIRDCVVPGHRGILHEVCQLLVLNGAPTTHIVERRSPTPHLPPLVLLILRHEDRLLP